MKERISRADIKENFVKGMKAVEKMLFPRRLSVDEFVADALEKKATRIQVIPHKFTEKYASGDTWIGPGLYRTVFATRYRSFAGVNPLSTTNEYQHIEGQRNETDEIQNMLTAHKRSEELKLFLPGVEIDLVIVRNEKRLSTEDQRQVIFTALESGINAFPTDPLKAERR